MHKLMEQLAAAKAKLSAALEGADAEAIKSATDEVKAAQAAIDAAKQGEALIKSLGTGEGKADAKGAGTLGEFAAKNLDMTGLRLGAAETLVDIFREHPDFERKIFPVELRGEFPARSQVAPKDIAVLIRQGEAVIFDKKTVISDHSLSPRRGPSGARSSSAGSCPQAQSRRYRSRGSG